MDAPPCDRRSGRARSWWRGLFLCGERVKALGHVGITDVITLMGYYQSYYGFNKNYGVYFEVIDYNKVLRDATKRNRIFFDNLNLVKDYG
ncbi:MAG TPA: hypothetical protein VNZ53_23790 [Steroidobacteraceae bacterium]|nr:hypothetical protein [Steroidobacteraceae bacterium]